MAKNKIEEAVDRLVGEGSESTSEILSKAKHLKSLVDDLVTSMLRRGLVGDVDQLEATIENSIEGMEDALFSYRIEKE